MDKDLIPCYNEVQILSDTNSASYLFFLNKV